MENLNEVIDHPKFMFQRGDIRDKTVPNDVFGGVDSVIHLAALIDISASVADPIQNHEVNVDGTFNMLQAAVKHKVKKFVFASSTAVYGDAKTLPLQENIAAQPDFSLRRLKSCGRSILQCICKLLWDSNHCFEVFQHLRSQEAKTAPTAESSPNFFKKS